MITLSSEMPLTARRIILASIITSTALFLLLAYLTEIHTVLLGTNIISTNTYGITLFYNNNNGSINGISKTFREPQHLSAINNKNIKPLINVHNFGVSMTGASSFPCINATAYQPRFQICIYNPSHDVHISGRLNKGLMWEPHVHHPIVEALQKDQDMNFIDIGANLGTHTLYMATLGRKVLAVEPVQENIIRLHRSVLLNNLQDRVTLLKNAISDSRTKVSLQTSFANGNNQGSFKITGVNQGQIQSILMDDLLLITNFTKAVMKIDIEGYESNAFAHASKFLSKIYIPLICMEWDHLSKWYVLPWTKKHKEINAMLKFFKVKGYSPYINETKLSTENWGSWPVGKWPYDVKFILNNF